MKYIAWQELKKNDVPEEEGFPLGPAAEFLSQFKFWQADTNFILDSDFYDAVDDTLGVESFTVLTPYKFIISIGACFSEEQIKKDIENLIKEEDDDIAKLREDLQKYQSWAIFILPNGEISYTFNEESDFNEKIAMYTQLKSELGGRIITPNTV